MSEEREVEVRDAGRHVFEVVWSRPPNNYIDASLVRGIASAVEALDHEHTCRVVVFTPQGRHFCAGANLAGRDRSQDKSAVGDLYREGLRLFGTAKPIVAAMQGAAIGGGLGLAVAADFRIAAEDARMSANFSRLGYFPGFGLTHTLPRLVGMQNAARVLYPGRNVAAAQALEIGLVDAVVPAAALRDATVDYAATIAAAAPVSVQAIRARLRTGLAAAVAAAMEIEAGGAGTHAGDRRLRRRRPRDGRAPRAPVQGPLSASSEAPSVPLRSEHRDTELALERPSKPILHLRPFVGHRRRREESRLGLDSQYGERGAVLSADRRQCAA